MADEKQGSWLKRIVVGLFMFVIALSFAITGTSDIFSGMSNRTVAVVGKAEISTLAYQSEYERTMGRIAQEQGKRLSASEAKAQQIDQQVLSSMVVRQTIHNHADSLGVTTSDKTTIREIKSFDAFNGIMGEFDEATFLETIGRSGFTRNEFEENLRGDLTTRQLTGAVMSGVELPSSMAEAIVKERLQRRFGSYIVLSPDLAGQMEAPTEEQLREHYEDQILSYNVPESRDITFLLISPQDFVGDISIADETVREVYDLSLAQYTTVETRVVERIFGSEEQIQAAMARAQAGESFLTLGQELGLSTEEVELGEVDRRGIADADVAATAFGAEAPGIYGPVEGLSWSLVRVVSINPEVVTPFEDVAGTIREELLLREAKSAMIDQLESIEDGIASGDPLEDLASRAGLQTVSVKNVLRSGENVDGVAVEGLPEDNTELLKEAFASAINFDSDLIEFGEDSFFVVRVDAIHPSAPQSFEEVRVDVQGSWMIKSRRDKLVDMARNMVQRGNDGAAFETMAQEVDRGVLRTPGPLNRGQSTDLFSQSLVSQLFAAEPGTFMYAGVELGESIVVMRYDEVVEAPDEVVQSLAPQFKEQLDDAMRSDVQNLYLAALSKDNKVRQNPGAIAQATGQPTGQ